MMVADFLIRSSAHSDTSAPRADGAPGGARADSVRDVASPDLGYFLEPIPLDDVEEDHRRLVIPLASHSMGRIYAMP
jgi:hypothetical protein